jgi:poly-gamma-glutamate capsule biosynthesis protein CapA/YwtB (metallophosphatase superfamily)
VTATASTGGAVRLVAVGDIQPNRPDPAALLELVRSELADGDLRICQLEATLSTEGVVRTDVRNPAHRVDPRNIEALTAAGFDIVSFAGNNNLDYGLDAFYDTIDLCRARGIAVVGAGHDLSEACAPVVLPARGRRVAFVNFCSILRDGYAATNKRGGLSPLHVSTFYEPVENIYEQPGTPSRTVTVVDQHDLGRVASSIEEARRQADIVAACFHWGVHFTHDLAMYQPDVAYAAIDAGADLVLGTHPHCLQGIDVYKGKPIFYSLGNFAFEQPDAIARHGVAEYLSFYGLPVDDALPQHPHPRHCRLTIVAKVTFDERCVAEVRVTPVYFNDDAQPEPLVAGTPRHEEVMGLIEDLSAELGTVIRRDGDDALVALEKATPLDARMHIRARAMSYPHLSAMLADGGSAADPVLSA